MKNSCIKVIAFAGLFMAFRPSAFAQPGGGSPKQEATSQSNKSEVNTKYEEVLTRLYQDAVKSTFYTVSYDFSAPMSLIALGADRKITVQYEHLKISIMGFVMEAALGSGDPNDFPNFMMMLHQGHLPMDADIEFVAHRLGVANKYPGPREIAAIMHMKEMLEHYYPELAGKFTAAVKKYERFNGL